MTSETLHRPFIAISMYQDEYSKVKGLLFTPSYTDILHSRYNQKIILIYVLEGYITSPSQYKWISNIKLGLKDFLFVPFEFVDEFHITDTTEVTNNILDKLEVLQKTMIPGSVDVDIVRNEGTTADEEVSGLVINLLQAITIVFFILLLFLGSEAASVVVIAIPLTLASVFGIGLLDGQTINRITLFALILSLGLLVDNATVVVENAVRHIEKAK